MAYQGGVLIVDDKIVSRESLWEILSPLYEAFTAQDREEALQAIRNKEINLVTPDLNMPDLSGTDVLEEIKGMSADIDVIIVTGQEGLKNAQEAMNDGTVGFITKPFNATDVVDSVSKAVVRREFNQKMGTLIQKLKAPGVAEEEEIEKILLY